MLSALAKTLFGSENDRVLKRMQASVDAINALEPELEKLSDEELVARTPSVSYTHLRAHETV